MKCLNNSLSFSFIFILIYTFREARKKSATCVSWHPKYPDFFAVGFVNIIYMNKYINNNES